MFVLFTPFTFLFSCFYFLFLYSLIFLSDFFMFWVVMECSSLVFMGICYSSMPFGFSSLMTYFLLQAFCSVNLLVFYFMSLDLFLFMFFCFKLAVFPFFSWYYPVMNSLPNFIFFLCSTFHKFPSVLMFMNFLNFFSIMIVFAFLMLTVIYAAVFMFNMSNFRSILIFSSVGNNSWMLFSSFVSYDFFVLFFCVYTLNFFLALYFFSAFMKLPSFFSLYSCVIFSFIVLSAAGFPPFPIFFLKLFIVYSLISSSVYYSLMLFIFLIFVVIMMSSYFRFLMSYYVNSYSTVSFLYF